MPRGYILAGLPENNKALDFLREIHSDKYERSGASLARPIVIPHTDADLLSQLRDGNGKGTALEGVVLDPMHFKEHEDETLIGAMEWAEKPESRSLGRYPLVVCFHGEDAGFNEVLTRVFDRRAICGSFVPYKDFRTSYAALLLGYTITQHRRAIAIERKCGTFIHAELVGNMVALWGHLTPEKRLDANTYLRGEGTQIVELPEGGLSTMSYDG